MTRNGNQHIGGRLDLQTLCDLLIDVAFSGVKLRVLGPAYGISSTEASRIARRYGVCRRPKRRIIRAIRDSSCVPRPEMV